LPWWLTPPRDLLRAVSRPYRHHPDDLLKNSASGSIKIRRHLHPIGRPPKEKGRPGVTPGGLLRGCRLKLRFRRDLQRRLLRHD
jgi:hypothetical protein